jgi:hypothetical protein
MLHHSLQSPTACSNRHLPTQELHSDTHLHHQHVSLRRLLWRSHFDDSLSARAVRWRCSKWDDWWVTCSTVSVTCIPLPIVVVSDSRGHTEKQNNGSGGESHLVAWPRSQRAEEEGTAVGSKQTSSVELHRGLLGPPVQPATEALHKHSAIRLIHKPQIARAPCYETNYCSCAHTALAGCPGSVGILFDDDI